MKKLVVYYSFEGNTKLMAESIAQTVEADILELKLVKESESKGFMRYVWGGKEALMKKKPELLTFDKNPQDYDLLFIGTPVWAWSYAPALSTFFSEVKVAHKKIALFCCHGGGKGKTLKKMEAAITNNQIIGTIDFIDPKKKNREANIEKVKQWAKEIVSKV